MALVHRPLQAADRSGTPGFYDKLLAVPLMNMAIRLDRRGGEGPRRDCDTFDPAQARRLAHAAPAQSGVHCRSGLSRSTIVSDPTASYRPRRWLPLLISCLRR